MKFERKILSIVGAIGIIAVTNPNAPTISAQPNARSCVELSAFDSIEAGNVETIILPVKADITNGSSWILLEHKKPNIEIYMMERNENGVFEGSYALPLLRVIPVDKNKTVIDLTGTGNHARDTRVIGVILVPSSLKMKFNAHGVTNDLKAMTNKVLKTIT